MMEGETSKTLYKLFEYNNTLYQIPIRNIEQQHVLLLSDVQLLLPKATAFLSNSKLVPFELDPNNHYTELIPKRVSVSNQLEDNSTIWEVHVPKDYTTDSLIQSNIEMQIKMDQLAEKLDRILSLQQENNTADNTTTSITTTGDEVNSIDTSIITNEEDITADQTEHDDNDNNNNANNAAITNNTTAPIITNTEHQRERSNSPPPAFSTSSQAPSSSSNNSRQQQQQLQHEAPPSYETSVLSTIKAINSKLCLYESHIYNRHKSPKWLAKRQEWISREPNSIEEVAYQLVQLEMALLWTAVTESWIQERETWLTLVASARSERHLAGAIINLERHTLVMDDDWVNIRERWINELLEMVVLPLSHG